MGMSSSIHLTDKKLEIQIGLNQKLIDSTFNAMQIKAGNYYVDIFATRDQLKQIADAIYKAIIESAES